LKKIARARPKEKEIFAGFAGRRQAASRWGGDTASEASGNLPFFTNF